MSLLVNLLGGPGAGKSTLAAGLFHELKTRNKSVELVTEYAKDLTWEKAWDKRGDPFTILGEQHWRIKRVYSHVDLTITDSPILLSSVYNKTMPRCYHETILWAHAQYDNLNFFVKRTKPYAEVGRDQNYSRAQYLDERTKEVLNGFGVNYTEVTGDAAGLAYILGGIDNAIHSSK